MNEKHMYLMISILLSLVVPALAVRLSQGIHPTVLIPTEPTATTEQATTSAVPATTAKIWVLTSSGETVQMVLEEYLVGVILAEMPTSYEPAALQAQATVARTYALRRQADARHPNGAVCTDSTCCQAYISTEEYLDGLGFPEDVRVARSAVAATRARVLTYENSLIEATYFHSSGGKTEDAVAVWGTAYPYLQAVDSPGEEQWEHYSDTICYTKAQLEELTGRTLTGHPGGWIGWTTYTVGGGVDIMYFAGEPYHGTDLRRILNLNSTVFSMEPKGDGLSITTYGKGHRVGMSQTGAQAMALEGSTWQEILAHYYPGTRIDKMEYVG